MTALFNARVGDIYSYKQDNHHTKLDMTYLNNSRTGMAVITLVPGLAPNLFLISAA